MTRSFTTPHVDEHTELHLSQLAVMTIDCQGDWTDPDALYGIPAAAAVVPAVAEIVGAARDAGVPVVHVIRIYDGTDGNADRCRRADMAAGLRHCAPGAPGTELLAELRPAGYTGIDADVLLAGGVIEIGPREFVVYKPRFGAFSQPALQPLLDQLGVDSIAVCGISFPRCVIGTLLGAIDLDYRTGLVVDATSEVDDRQAHFLAGAGLQLVDVAGLSAALAASGRAATDGTAPTGGDGR